jgi:hypothetical protein
MDTSHRLLDEYLPPVEGFLLESLLATTYQVDFEFLEEELLASALGVRSPLSRMRAFRSELEKRLQTTDVTVLYDIRGCERLARLSPRVDPIPIMGRKLHSKISLLMWVRQDPDGVPDRLMRLIIGSANLTRQGFRENYECVASLTYGGRNRSPRGLLLSAINGIRQIAADTHSPQLERQLDAFEQYVASLPADESNQDSPIDLVLAEEVLNQMQSRWNELSSDPPGKLTIVSPFWPEGETAADAIHDVIHRFQFPPTVELICRGVTSEIGQEWVPQFDPDVAVMLKDKYNGRLYLRAAWPHAGKEKNTVAPDEADDETEEYEVGRSVAATTSDEDDIHRSLHAKIIVLDGPQGSVLYAGSSNCTRRGLGLGGPANWETGLVYRLTRQQRRQIEPLLAFAGPASEVLLDHPPKAEKLIKEKEPAVPWFLTEVTAAASKVTLHFNPEVPRPDDLVVLMEIPRAARDKIYWLLYRQVVPVEPLVEVTRDLADCSQCDSDLIELKEEGTPRLLDPHVLVEVRWDGNAALFPVRFDDKAMLPLVLLGRKPTEGELIDYFLFGREPGDGEGRDILSGNGTPGPKGDGPVDTRRILAYFIRRFVQAIPGIEAQLQQASYSRTALDAALRGPTSPLQLAERAAASLTRLPTPDEPAKSPMAVGFQLTEILAALLRSQSQVDDETLQECYQPAIARCRELLEGLMDSHPELRGGPFRYYHDRFVGEAS